jgi:hypothetical protein
MPKTNSGKDVPTATKIMLTNVSGI